MMLCFQSFKPVDIDPQRWFRCRQEARRQLLARGFDPLSKKLAGAIHKRAQALWNEGSVK